MTDEYLFGPPVKVKISAIPTLSSRSTPPQRTWIARGRCPCCHNRVKNWRPLLPYTWWSTMCELGVDPVTGHLQNCEHKDIALRNARRQGSRIDSAFAGRMNSGNQG